MSCYAAAIDGGGVRQFRGDVILRRSGIRGVDHDIIFSLTLLLILKFRYSYFGAFHYTDSLNFYYGVISVLKAYNMYVANDCI